MCEPHRPKAETAYTPAMPADWHGKPLCEGCGLRPATTGWFYAEPDVVCSRVIAVCDRCWEGLAETALWIDEQMRH
jgi:hypothetical protein